MAWHENVQTPEAGILPASRQGACPTLARHASENECKPPALNNRPQKWAAVWKCAEMCAKVRKSAEKNKKYFRRPSPHARSPPAQPDPSGGQLKPIRVN